METRHAGADGESELREGWVLGSPGSSVLLHIIRWIIGPAQTDSPSAAVKVPDVKTDLKQR